MSITVRQISRGSSSEIAKQFDASMGILQRGYDGMPSHRYDVEPINPTAGVKISEFKQGACKILNKLERVGQSIIVTQHTSRTGEYIRSWRITLVEVDKQ